MEFKFLTNEHKDVLDLIKKVFKIDEDINFFNLFDNQKILILKNKNEVVGTALITLKYDPFKNIKTYYLDYICIKENYQNQGLGKKLFEEVIKIAEKDNIDYIELTSKKERKNARKIYIDCGMKIKDTDLFIKKL